MNENDIEFFLNENLHGNLNGNHDENLNENMTENLIENKNLKKEVRYVMYFLKKRIISLKKEILNLKGTIREREFYSSIIQDVTEILAEKSNIDDAAQIIKERMGLHTCYINYDIDTKANRANIAGLATNFGVWFSELTKKIQGIPFSFIGEKGEIPLNAAQFISTLKKPVTLRPESYCHLFLAKNIHELNIDVKTVHEFLTTELGLLHINPLKNDRGSMILIKNPGEAFNDDEKSFIRTLAHSIAITLDRMYHMSHDELGIKNIMFIRKQLEQFRRENIDHALAMIKVKGMKQINDYYSHTMGNTLLKKIIQRVTGILKSLGYENAENLIGRKSGVILLVCLPNISDEKRLSALMSIMSEQLSQPYQLDDYKILDFDNSFGFGACLSRKDRDVDTLLTYTSDALQASRRTPKCSQVIFNRNIEEEKTWRKKIIDTLKSIDNKSNKYKLKLHYQQKTDLRDHKIIGFEALLRMQNGSPQLIRPYEFIKIAEEENLIGYVDRWVAREVCLRIKEWAEKGIQVPVSMNISRYHIHSKDLVSEIAGIFNDLDFHRYKHLFKIEITETGFIDKRSVDVLLLLNKILGLKVTIDDVGKSHANLHAILTLYVNNLLETVKIDKDYTDKLIKRDNRGRVLFDQNNEAILDEDGCKYICTILNMFHGLFNTPGIESPSIICEGVEYMKQAEWLYNNNCFYVQGYLFGMAEPPEDCEKRLADKGYHLM